MSVASVEIGLELLVFLLLPKGWDYTHVAPAPDFIVFDRVSVAWTGMSPLCISCLFPKDWDSPAWGKKITDVYSYGIEPAKKIRQNNMISLNSNAEGFPGSDPGEVRLLLKVVLNGHVHLLGTESLRTDPEKGKI